jgi:hypothetical protein
MKTITETRMLPYIFTPEEHLENSAEMARLYDQLEELDATHRQIKASLKEELEALSANLGRVVRLVRDKRDYRKTECRWIFDCPAVGQKTLRRNDTDIDVEVRRMEEHEKQESLNLQPVTEDLPLVEVINQGLNPEWDGSMPKPEPGPLGPCVHERLNEDGVCRSCGQDVRTGHPAEPMSIKPPPAMPETAKAEAGKKSRFGPQKV